MKLSPRRTKKHSSPRTLRCESLEDRRLLAVMVGNEAALRAAVAAPVADPDIVFTADINLTAGGGGELLITEAVNIDGNGFSLTQTASTARVMHIDDGDGYIDTFAVTISDLTITGGKLVNYSGAGIRNVEELTLNNVTISGNTATGTGGNTYSDPAVYSIGGAGMQTQGTTVVNNSTITGNVLSSGDVFYDNGAGTIINFIDCLGGGVQATGVGSLTMVNTNVTNNSSNAPAGFAGGMVSDGDGGTYITGGSISNNFAENTGGGLRLAGYAPIRLDGVTVSNNVAGNATPGASPGSGGIEIGGADVVDVEITNSTISGNSINGATNATTQVVFLYGAGMEVIANGTVSLDNTDVTGNVVFGTGPGIMLARGGGISTSSGSLDLTLTGGTLSNNEVDTPAYGPYGYLTYGGGLSWGGGFGVAGAQQNILLDGTIVENNHAGDGGAMSGRRADAHVELTVRNATVTGNFADEAGGAFSTTQDTNITIEGSTVSGNSTGGAGGAVFLSNAFVGNGFPNSYANTNLFVSDSTFTGNQSVSTGSAINAGTTGLTYTNMFLNQVVIENSTISGNSSAANSTVDGYDISVTIFQSTLSGNTANGLGAGFYGQIRCDAPGAGAVCYANTNKEAVFTIDRSTFTANYQGGAGVVASGPEADLTVTNSLLSGNTSAGADLVQAISSQGFNELDVNYSLVQYDGTGTLVNGVDGNIVGSAATLGPLANNGGPTMTHALLSGSLGIDAATPGQGAGETDQRGYGPRDFNGRMDMGAYEYGATASTGPDCDFDDDGDCDLADIDMLTANTAAGTNNPAFDLNGDSLVNALDITAWLIEAGGRPEHAGATNGNPFFRGDFNLDGAVNGQDFVVWNVNKFTNVTGWSQGNGDGNGAVNGQDFVIWNTNKFKDAATDPSGPNLNAGGGIFAGNLGGMNALSSKADVGKSGLFKSGQPLEARHGRMEARRGSGLVEKATTPVVMTQTETEIKQAAEKQQAQLDAEQGSVVYAAAPAMRIAASDSMIRENRMTEKEEAVEALFAQLGA